MTEIFIADISGLDIASAAELVSDYRRQKALRIKDALKQRQSLGVELLLQKAVGKEAAVYRIDENGKPRFVELNRFFSLSHCEKYAVCAVSDCEVGVDIERPRADLPKLAKRFFTKTEYERIASSADPDKEACLCWVRKESYIKATGEGLKRPLNSFEAADRIGDYCVKSFDLGEFCIGVCVKADDCDIRLNTVEI